MKCVYLLDRICLLPINGSASLFGFKDFIAALALLVIIYTIADVRYRFRISVAPVGLFKITYVLVGLIGFATLATDVWISEKWLVPESLITAGIWQGILAALFLGLVVTWMHYAFIRPPIFGRNNSKSYAQELYRVILKGSSEELPIIAHELAASASSLVTHANALRVSEKERKEGRLKPRIEAYANDLLSLIANRKFCRHLVASSPVTAIRFVETVVDAKAFSIPIGLFLQNISIEAIRDKDSALYHEDDGYYSGLLGYVKPFSQALYGHYELVEGLKHHSPLDIDYKFVWSWDSLQFEAYCRAVQLTLKSYLDGAHWGEHSYVLTRALSCIQETTCRAISELKKTDDDYLGDAWDQLSEGVDFIKDSIDLIGKLKPTPKAKTLRIRAPIRGRLSNEDLYDRIAEAMFEIIYSASNIDGPPSKAWSIHHNAIWGDFFDLSGNNLAWKIVHFKLRRLLYLEMLRLESLPTYKSARVLGICLNVMGFSHYRHAGLGREYAALKTTMLTWTQRNYLRLREVNEEIADSCLIGSITLDASGTKLVKTFAKGLRAEPDREYLQLLPPPQAQGQGQVQP